MKNAERQRGLARYPQSIEDMRKGTEVLVQSKRLHVYHGQLACREALLDNGSFFGWSARRKRGQSEFVV